MAACLRSLLRWSTAVLFSLGLWLTASPPDLSAAAAGPGPAGIVLPAQAAPGLCVGPVCGDQIERRLNHPGQLRMRLSNQRGQREQVVVLCPNGELSPKQGRVERGYAGAVARRACRLTGEAAAA